MLTTSRRLAWVSSLLARSPRCTARIRRRVLDRVLDALVDAGRGHVALLDQLRQAPLVVAGEQVDLADLAQVHPHAVGRRALGRAASPGRSRRRRRRLSRCSSASDLVDLVVEDRAVALERVASSACRRRPRRPRRSSSTVSSMRDALVLADVADAVEHLAGELDVAQHVGDLLGVELTLMTPVLEQLVPLGGVDRLEPAERHVHSARVLRACRQSPPPARSSIRDGANLATTLPPRRPCSACVSSSSCSRASRSSADLLGVADAGPPGELAPHGRGDQVAGLGLGVDVEVGDRRPLEHLPGLGIGRRRARPRVALRRGQGEERPPMRLVVEQLLDQPRRRSRPSPGRAARSRRTRRSPAGAAAARAPTRDVGRRVPRSATATRSATGSPTSVATWPAYSLRTLGSGCSLTTAIARSASRARSSGDRGGRPSSTRSQPEAEERRRVGDRRRQGGRDRVCASSPGSLPSGNAATATCTWYFCSHS